MKNRIEKVKKVLVTMTVYIYLMGSMVLPIFAYGGFSTAEHSHYVPATFDGDPDELIANTDVDGISFYISKINDGNNKSSNYNTIRACLMATRTSTMWYGEGSTSPKFYSGKNTNFAYIALNKKVYYEIYTGDTSTKNTVSVAYYGNNSSKDAYIYIREGVNCAVSTN